MGKRLVRLRGNDEQQTTVLNEKRRAARATRRMECATLSLAARPVLEVWAAWIVISPRRWSVRRVGGALTASVVIAVLAEMPHTGVGVQKSEAPPEIVSQPPKDERPGINSRCEEGLIRHTCEHITERYKKRTSASGHFRGNDDVRDECGVPAIATELVHGRERRRKRQAAAAFLVVPAFTYKLPTGIADPQRMKRC